MATRNEIVTVLEYLGRAYPDGKLASESIPIYVAQLVDLDIGPLQAAAQQHVATEKWFPKISELRTLVAAISNPERPLPHEAWEIVMAHVRRCGVYCRCVNRFQDHPDVAKALAGIGGYMFLCSSPERDMVSNRAQFIAAYQAIIARHNADARLLPSVAEFRRLAGKRAAVAGIVAAVAGKLEAPK